MTVQRPLLVIGTKRYSSWSLRAWLALKQSGLAFDEKTIRLRQPDTAARALEYSPSGRVPVMIDGERRVWDSLAICEYAADMLPGARLWPEDPGARALARAISAEMHAGFPAMREHLSMDVAKSAPLPDLPDAAKKDVARVQAIWTDCRARFGQSGPFLFGHFTIADACYAPVATRFRSYSVPLDAVCAAYADAIYALAPMQAWIAAAKSEPS